MSIFTAAVQYDDFTGTVAADQSDTESLSDYVVSLGKMADTDTLVAVRFVFSGNHGREILGAPVVVYVIPEGAGEPPEEIKAIPVDLPWPQFFKFFKRFDMIMTRHGRAWPEDIVRGPFYD